MANPCPCCGASPEHFADAADPEVTLQVIRAGARAAAIRECQAFLKGIHAEREARDAFAGVTRHQAAVELDALFPRDTEKFEPAQARPPDWSAVAARTAARFDGFCEAVRHLVEGQGSAESYARAAAVLDIIGGK